MKLWRSIINHGVNPENLDWDNRNLRFMNAMAFILTCSMLMFTGFVIFFGEYQNLVLTGTAFILTSLYFIIPWKLGLTIAKIYFSVIPVALITMFSIYAVGDVGNDKFYLLSSAIIPLIIFREKWSYIPLVWLNMTAFFFIGYAHEHIDPISQLPESQMIFYRAINVIMMFTFIYAGLQLFKIEIFGYQSEVEEQKKIIEEKNEETRQSIEYAKKIQEAILPSPAFQEKHLPESFIWYRPKDIVAGDFYWMDERNGIIYFAAADCTGHGVPGAMVSVVCHNALNQALNEFDRTTPGDILNKTRELVIKTFQQSDREVKDGMDIGLCAFNSQTKELLFAGANNGMYLLRNGELIETKPDKQPIGNFDNPLPFTNHALKVEANDIIYLFTDGFADQFGGDKGKKYKYKAFKKFLETLINRPIGQHGQLIASEFENWKGDLEQVDDVCIIGVKF